MMAEGDFCLPEDLWKNLPVDSFILLCYNAFCNRNVTDMKSKRNKKEGTMLRHKYKAAAAMTGLALLAMSTPAAAAQTTNLAKECSKDGKQVIVWTSKYCNNGQLPGVILPGGCFPGTNLPGQPDNETPDTNLPNQPGEDSEQTSYVMQVVELVNVERAKEGLAALTFDEQMGNAALVRAKETEQSFSHTRPDGRSFSTALTDAGVTYRSAGENIAYGQKTPQQVVEGWMNSPGHRANIMNSGFTRIGVGYYQNSAGVNYWTQLFAN